MSLNKLKVGGLFTKSEKQEDGTIIVGGICSSESVDSDGEVILAKAMKDAIPDFMKWATLKEMHKSDTSPGVILKMEVQDDGKTYIECHAVDPVTVLKIETGVFKGFSIGAGSVVRDALNKLRIVKFKLNEVSLVDRPANPDSLFSFVKMESIEQDESDLPEQEIPHSQEVESSEEPVIEVSAIEEVPVVIDEVTVDNLTTDEKSVNLKEEELNKAGSRNSKTDAERIQKIHDLTLELGAISPSKTFKSVSNEFEVDSLEKFKKLNSELQEAVTKAIKLEEEKETLTKRVKELENLPKPRKASVLSIGKSEDYQFTENNFKVEPVLKGDGSIDELATIFKTQTFQSGLLK